MKNDKTNLIIWAVVALVIGVLIGTFLIGPMTTTGNAKLVANASLEVKDPFTLKEATAINTCRNKESTKMDLECLEAEIGEPIDQIRRKWWWILIGNPCDCGDGAMTFCLHCNCCLLQR